MTTKRWGRGKRPDNNVMNRTESSYASELQRRKDAGDIIDYKFHAFTLTIANPPNALNARWTPDFAVWDNEMILQFHEVKGFMQDHAIVRIKAAASQYPHPVFVVRKKTKKQGGGWSIEQM